MTQDFNNLRTTEDIVNALSVLYFNLNEIERNYYNIFLNPEEMTIDLQRYNEQGVLEVVPVKNLARLQMSALTGSGSPNGTVIANTGTLYIDLNTSDLYYKSSGSDSYGWVLVWSKLNANFLPPDGDGGNLTNLNMNNAGQGTLAVTRGGTGVNNITGLVRGNGTNPMSAAVDGVDYLGAASMVGVVSYYPIATVVDGVVTIPITGWFPCDGRAVSRITYARLFGILGTTYGAGDGSTTFNIPNLMDNGSGRSYYVRSWDKVTAFPAIQQGQVGEHNHPLAGNVGVESEHVHDRGTMNITGQHSGVISWGGTPSSSGCFTARSEGNTGIGHSGDKHWNYSSITLDASRSWTGVTGGPRTYNSQTETYENGHTHSLNGLNTGNNITDTSKENRVLSMMMVPIIKY